MIASGIQWLGREAHIVVMAFSAPKNALGRVVKLEFGRQPRRQVTHGFGVDERAMCAFAADNCKPSPLVKQKPKSEDDRLLADIGRLIVGVWAHNPSKFLFRSLSTLIAKWV